MALVYPRNPSLKGALCQQETAGVAGVMLKTAVLGTSPGAPGDPPPCRALELKVFSIFPIIGSWAASVTGSWPAWVLLLHCMRTTLDEALAFSLPWSPLSWPSISPMETKHPALGPRRTLEDPSETPALGLLLGPVFCCNVDLSRLSLHSCENAWVWRWFSRGNF